MFNVRAQNHQGSIWSLLVLDAHRAEHGSLGAMTDAVREVGYLCVS
jgi:hypothetical protein